MGERQRGIWNGKKSGVEFFECTKPERWLLSARRVRVARPIHGGSVTGGIRGSWMGPAHELWLPAGKQRVEFKAEKTAKDGAHARYTSTPRLRSVRTAAEGTRRAHGQGLERDGRRHSNATRALTERLVNDRRSLRPSSRSACTCQPPPPFLDCFGEGERWRKILQFERGKVCSICRAVDAYRDS